MRSIDEILREFELDVSIEQILENFGIESSVLDFGTFK